MTQPSAQKIVVARHGPPEVLTLVVGAADEPAPGHVRLRVVAAGVSAFDLMYRRWGRLPGSPKLPFTLGEDVVGLVDEIGEGVEGLEIGELVAAGTWALGVGGGYSDYVCLPASELVPVPAGVDPAQAVCLVVNYLTAHQHLYAMGRAERGERILVHGAAGGVGSAVVELAVSGGLEVYGTASGAGLDAVRAMGATPVDYRSEDFVHRIRTLESDGVDLVIDPVGGGRHLWRSYRVLRNGGRLVWLGSAAVEEHGLRVGLLSMATVFLLRMLPDGKAAPRCPTMDKFAVANPGWSRNTLSGLLDLLAAGKLSPVVAARIPLADAARAHEMLETGGHSGKIVLVTDAYEGGRLDRP